MPISLYQLNFTDICRLDEQALQKVYQSRSFTDLWIAYLQQSIVPLSSVSLQATTNFIEDLLGNFFYVLLCFYNTVSFLFSSIWEKDSSNHCLSNFTLMLMYIRKFILDVFKFILLLCLTACTLPMRLFSSLCCYAIASLNYMFTAVSCKDVLSTSTRSSLVYIDFLSENDCCSLKEGQGSFDAFYDNQEEFERIVGF